jgi:hypothetical protein
MKKIRLLISCVLSVAALFCGFASQGQIISTIAGSTVVGGGGPPPPPPTEGVAATASTLNEPYGMAQDASGNLYFADYQNSLIRMVNYTTGIISIVAGNGTPGYAGDGGLANAAACEIDQPKGVALDPMGNIYISDYGNDVVRMINHTTGIISTIAGIHLMDAAPYGVPGPATAAHINPNGIVVGPAIAPSTNPVIYFSNGYINAMGTVTNYSIYAITNIFGAYVIEPVAGNGAAGTPPYGDGGPASAANLDAPRGLAIDGSGNLYIADMSHNLIRKVSGISTGAATITTVVGNDLAGTAGDAGNGGVATAAACEISAPTGVAVDGSGNLYVTDVGSDFGMTATWNDIRYVAFSTGIISTIADASGTTGASPYGDGGSALAANLFAPVSVLLDNQTGSAGNYYISDEEDDRIRYVNVSASAGSPPTFTGGSPQPLVVCENSAATSLNTLLEVGETTTGLTLTWSVATPPAHGGTLTAAYSTTSTGSSITPTGLSYTPPTGFSGTDAFKIQVSNGTSTATTTINVTVNPLAAVASIGGTVTNVCVGLNITLTDATTGGVWAAANANARVTGGTVTGLAGGADEIYYIVSNSCGPDSARLAITVNPSVTPSVSLTSTLGTTTCGVPGTFAATPVGGGPTPAYQWSVNGAAVTGATLPSYTYVPVAGDVVSVELISDAPCAATTTATATITMSGGSSILPTINIATGLAGDTLCIGVPITLTSAITNGGSSPTYNWTLNGVSSGSGSTFLYTPTAASEGDIIVCELTSSIPCAIPSSVLSNDIIIHIRSAATSSVNITSNPGSVVCEGTTVTFAATETGGGSEPVLRWSRAGINVATGPSYTCVPDNGDAVYCTMHSSIACSPSDSVNSNVINMRASVPLIPAVTITSNITSTGLYGTIEFIADVTSATLTPVYQWYVNGEAVPGAVSSVYVLNGNLSASYIVNCVVGSGDGCNLNGTSNDISVSFGLSVKSTGASTTEMKLMPNPNKGVFSLTLQSDNTEQADVVITNILGEQVKTLSITTNNTIDISLDQAPGIYILTATTSEGRFEAKVMVN